MSVHWFTATPDPSISYFKPFVFTPNAQVSSHTESPKDVRHFFMNKWYKLKLICWIINIDKFYLQVEREHHLYKLHTEHVARARNEKISELLRDVENGCITEIEDFIQKYKSKENNINDLDDLMKKCVENEIQIITSS